MPKTIVEQMEGGGDDGSKPAADLSGVPIRDLVKEIKNRTHTVIVGLLLDDEEGDERIVTMFLGSRVAAVGMCEEIKDSILNGDAE